MHTINIFYSFVHLQTVKESVFTDITHTLLYAIYKDTNFFKVE